MPRLVRLCHAEKSKRKYTAKNGKNPSTPVVAKIVIRLESEPVDACELGSTEVWPSSVANL